LSAGLIDAGNFSRRIRFDGSRNEIEGSDRGDGASELYDKNPCRRPENWRRASSQYL